jgi:hypothetical protein
MYTANERLATYKERNMQKRGLSQEGMKVICCLVMVFGHTAALFFPHVMWVWMFGRFVFPLYCFMLVEGAYHTKNPLKYGLRLLIGALISELPYDYAMYGGFSWHQQSVMLTLLIGFTMVICMKCLKNPILQMLVVVPFALAAQWANVDYGGMGVVLIAMFALTRDMPHKFWIQTVALAAISYMTSKAMVSIGGIEIRVQLFAVFAMIPLSLYSGRKVTNHKALQWGFYLFYPVHLAVLYICKYILF